MVRHHAPALRCLDIHVGGDNVSFLPVRIVWRFHLFDQAVYSATDTVRDMQMLWSNVNRAAFENHLKGFANGSLPLQPWRAGMHTKNFFVIRPQRHHQFKISACHGVVERILDVFGAGERFAR